MTERQKKILIGVGSGAVALIVLYYLWLSRASASASMIPATTLGNAALPGINLSFQTTPLNFTNQPTGYVPLFGYIGYSGVAG